MATSSSPSSPLDRAPSARPHPHTSQHHTPSSPISATSLSVWQNVLSGMLGGSVSALVVSPLDVARTRLQLQGSVRDLPAHLRATGVWSALRVVGRTEGISGYFRGYTAAAIAIPTFWACFLPVYDLTKGALGRRVAADDDTDDFLRYAAIHSTAAIAAAVVADTVTNPLWMIRTRLQAHGLHSGIAAAAAAAAAATRAAGGAGAPAPIVPAAPAAYRGILHGLRTIVRTEGPGALYKGLVVSWLGSSHSAIQFPVYEFLKAKWVWPAGHPKAPGGGRKAAAAAAAVVAPAAEGEEEDLGAWASGAGGGETEAAALAAAAAAAASSPAAAVPVPRSTLGRYWNPLAGDGEIATGARLVIASSVAKVFASALTYPHEVVRARLQDQRGTGTGLAYTGALDCARKIFRREGIRGLWAGYTVNLVRTLPATAAMFISYEASLRFIKEERVVQKLLGEEGE
jgi:solute carrier family 25 folate transporter 32